MRKLKLQIANLEKNNENFIKEFDNINKGLSILFSKNTIDTNKDPLKIDEKPTTVSHKEVTEVAEAKDSMDANEAVSENNIEESIGNNIEGSIGNSIEEAVINTSMNNIFGVMSSNIIMEDNIDITDNLADEVNDIEEIIDDGIEELNEEEVEGLDDEIEGLDDDDVDGLDGEIIDDDGDEGLDDDEVEGLDDIILNDDNSKYFTMSVKELKEKCIEMGLKHSGNKNTLAQRIVDNLK